jgi:maltooligosyltrehalose trehalohydrolase
VTAFRVWAPTPKTVELEVGGDRVPMTPVGDRGWYEADVEWAGPGTDYRFVVDGLPTPDPRSPFQPEGVHGPSRVVDHDAFPWTDGHWTTPYLPAAVIYELHVGTFTDEGTFDAVIAKLDHLVDLGVDVIELLPVVEFPGERGWGYDGVDLYAPHHSYGGPDGLKRLVDACHHRGLGVVIDVVYNHLGPAGNYLSRFGPYFTDRYRTPWGDALNFDGPDSDEVRAFFVDNAVMWLRDYHADGLRLDAVHAILDTSATHLLEQIAEAVAQLGRPAFVIAESDLNDPRVVARPEVGGYGMDAQWSDDFHHALHVALTGETSGYYADFRGLADVAVALEQAFVYAGQYSPNRRRRHGRTPTGIPMWRFLGYLQDHDQIGNRAAGERSSMLMSTGRLKVAAALVLLSPFVPMLFQGEEWGASTPFQYFTDHDDPALAQAVSEGRRREFAGFGWAPEDVPDPQDPKTFERSKLHWAEVGQPPHDELLQWHIDVIALRRSAVGLPEHVEAVVDTAGQTLVMRRGPLTVAVNIGSGPATLPVDSPVVLASEPAVSAKDGLVTLPPDSVAIASGG